MHRNFFVCDVVVVDVVFALDSCYWLVFDSECRYCFFVVYAVAVYIDVNNIVVVCGDFVEVVAAVLFIVVTVVVDVAGVAGFVALVLLVVFLMCWCWCCCFLYCYFLLPH